jgi:hypothetical protein
MSAKIIMCSLLFVLGVVLGMLGANLLGTSGSQVPVRPANVPASAQWAGGADGGAWIECSPTGHGSLACRVFADVTGAMMEEKAEFSLDPKSVRPTLYSAGLIGAHVRFERAAKDESPSIP